MNVITPVYQLAHTAGLLDDNTKGGVLNGRTAQKHVLGFVMRGVSEITSFYQYKHKYSDSIYIYLVNMNF
jgi:hypothetical protein